VAVAVSRMAGRWQYSGQDGFHPRLSDVLNEGLVLCDLLPSEAADLWGTSNLNIWRWQKGVRRASWVCATMLAGTLVNVLAQERGLPPPFPYRETPLRVKRHQKIEAVRQRLYEAALETKLPEVGILTESHPSYSVEEIQEMGHA